MPRKKRSKDEIIEQILNNWVTLEYIKPDKKMKLALQLHYVSNFILGILLSESAKLMIYSGKDEK